MDEPDDPFAGIIRNCSTTADEEELRNCPFSVEFENFPESFASQSSSPIPSKQFGIIMLSLPVTAADSIDQNYTRKNEKFHTPSEHHNSQTYISGFHEQRPTTATAIDLPGNVSAVEATAADYGNGTEVKVRVDLGKDNCNLGFSKPREITVNWCHRGDGLGRIDEVEYSEGDIDEPLRKRTRISEKNLGVMQSSIPQIVIDVDAEITGLEGKEIVRNEVVNDNRIKRTTVDFAETESEDGENHVFHRKEHANGIKQSCTAGVDGSIRGRRELPLWMRGGEKNREVEDVGRKAMKKGQFKDIIEDTMVAFGKNGENKDADFFETAKRRDMFFPRPRWWSPELFVD